MPPIRIFPSACTCMLRMSWLAPVPVIKVGSMVPLGIKRTIRPTVVPLYVVKCPAISMRPSGYTCMARMVLLTLVPMAKEGSTPHNCAKRGESAKNSRTRVRGNFLFICSGLGQCFSVKNITKVSHSSLRYENQCRWNCLITKFSTWHGRFCAARRLPPNRI